MTPYYQHAGITIYHGDCREVLPELEPVDLLLTDPPYGIDRGHQNARAACNRVSHNRKTHDKLGDWDSQPVDPDLLRQCIGLSRNQIIWGGNYAVAAVLPSMGWIVWDKCQRLTMSDCELAFTSFQKATRIVQCNRKAIDLEGAFHPNQKPLSVIRFCFDFAGDDTVSVVDTFMGSGTVLRVAKDRGIRGIGIELEERYCEIAANRLRQEVLFA